MAAPIKILLIDDQPDFLATMSYWMKFKGYQVETASSGAAGVEAARRGGIEMIFIDFKMPGMNGVEALQKIREFNKTIPVIMITAHADDAMVHQIKDLNISGFFSKMGDFKELEQMLRVVVGNIQKTNPSSA